MTKKDERHKNLKTRGTESPLRFRNNSENFDQQSDVMHHFSGVNANHRVPQDLDNLKERGLNV